MRISKVNELITQELGKIIQENIEFEPGVMVTVLRADTSETLENTTVYVSIFPEKYRGSAMETLKSRIGEIQKALNRQLSLRFVPKILFKIDDSMEYVMEMDKVFEEVK